MAILVIICVLLNKDHMAIPKSTEYVRNLKKNNPEQYAIYREKKKISDKKWRDANCKTGFAKGRPKTGELRLVSPNAVLSQKHREKHSESHREYNRIKQAEWVARNPELHRERARNAYQRKKERMANKLDLKIENNLQMVAIQVS